MGFDVTAANIIFFIAVLTAGSVALGAYWQNASYVEDARRVDERRADERVHTNMTVTSATYDGSVDRFTVQIKNGGSTVLDVSNLAYVIDGAYVASGSIESAVVSGVGTPTDLWLPLETLEVNFLPIDPSPGYFQVVAENGARGNWRS